MVDKPFITGIVPAKRSFNVNVSCSLYDRQKRQLNSKFPKRDTRRRSRRKKDPEPKPSIVLHNLEKPKHKVFIPEPTPRAMTPICVTSHDVETVVADEMKSFNTFLKFIQQKKPTNSLEERMASEIDSQLDSIIEEHTEKYFGKYEDSDTSVLSEDEISTKESSDSDISSVFTTTPVSSISDMEYDDDIAFILNTNIQSEPAEIPQITKSLTSSSSQTQEPPKTLDSAIQCSKQQLIPKPEKRVHFKSKTCMDERITKKVKNLFSQLEDIKLASK